MEPEVVGDAPNAMVPRLHTASKTRKVAAETRRTGDVRQQAKMASELEQDGRPEQRAGSCGFQRGKELGAEASKVGERRLSGMETEQGPGARELAVRGAGEANGRREVAGVLELGGEAVLASRARPNSEGRGAMAGSSRGGQSEVGVGVLASSGAMESKERQRGRADLGTNGTGTVQGVGAEEMAAVVGIDPAEALLRVW